MTAPHIPRHRAPIIGAFARPAWYECQARRLAVLGALAAALIAAAYSLLAWAAP